MDKQFQETEDLVTRHFNDGHLDQLERELYDRIQSDAKDLRALFKQGVLAAGRYQLSDAARNFSVIAASGWKTGLARHNLATVYFRSGLTRVAIEMLLKEAKSQEASAATFFNLGIICDHVAALGDHIPPELVDCGLLAAGRNVRQDATQYFKRSLDAGAWNSGLDGALYLWPENVPQAWGFASTWLSPGSKAPADTCMTVSRAWTGTNGAPRSNILILPPSLTPRSAKRRPTPEKRL